MPPHSTSSLTQLRTSLPTYPYRTHIIDAIRNQLSLVVVGETGSGKTTQIPQYLYEEMAKDIDKDHEVVGTNDESPTGEGKTDLTRSEAEVRIRSICVTQPRRIAAITVCKRVCLEAGVRIGEDIGYSIRFEDVSGPKTKLRYVTDGILLRELCSDPNLTHYDCVVIDEAHERTLDTDIIIGLVKMAQLNRRTSRYPLRVVIMSATLNVEKFSDFFDGCPIFTIPGRTFDVSVKYHPSRSMEQLKMSYVDGAVDTALEVHTSMPSGDILVFLTGQREIYRAMHQFTENDTGEGRLKASVIPIYAALEHIDQRLAFDPAPEGYRKIVFATNIAQTSITIPGIVYVIDSGFVKQKTFEPSTGMDGLVVVPISQAAAIQRAGRAGRTQEGTVFRLYSKAAFEELERETVPEIQRSSLLSTVLTMKAMGIQDVLGFRFLDPPQPKHLRTALSKLRQLEAVDDESIITKLGMQMSRLPLSPYLSCALLHSAHPTFGCSRPLLIIAAMLSVEDIIQQPRSETSQARQQTLFTNLFSDSTGDHLTLYNIFVLGAKSKFDRAWCQDHFIHHRKLQHADAIHSQLETILIKLKIPLLTPPSIPRGDPRSRRPTKPSHLIHRPPILHALCQGYFHNLARRHPQGRSYYHYMGTTTTKDEDRSFFALNLHPTSTLNPRSHLSTSGMMDTDWVIYSQIMYTSQQCQLRHVSTVDPEWAIPLINRARVETGRSQNNRSNGGDDKRKKDEEDGVSSVSEARVAEINAARLRFLDRKKSKTISDPK